LTNNEDRNSRLGSLIWDKRPEFEPFEQHLKGQWLHDGPRLKLEFSRVSNTRHGALTLVIDEEHGAETTVAWRLSKRSDVNEAICDLRCREGTILKCIGQVGHDRGSNSSLPGADAIAEWRRSKNLDAVVWTALKSNFNEKSKEKRLFSVQAAIDHIQNLDANGRAKAFEYISRAPEVVKTPLRSALEATPWFQELQDANNKSES
jgi:hypothetical protein